MAEEKEKKDVKIINKTINKGAGGACGGIYFFGFLGALVYYFQQPQTFTQGLLSFIKAIAWPGMIVFKAFELLKL